MDRRPMSSPRFLNSIPAMNFIKNKARSIYTHWQLPPLAKTEYKMDRRGLPAGDPGIDRSVAEAVGWLCRAQDCNRLRDGGVARDYSLISGWNSSYPETTGYIVPTMIACAEAFNDDSLRDRARRMLDWLVSIQFPEGAFQGGLIDNGGMIPVTFNTGQILLGLARGTAEFGEAYRPAMQRAADWLVKTQDADGCWRSRPTPYAEPGEKTYETHVAWGLIEADRISPGKGYAEAALANMHWALKKQSANGWFADCCLTDPARPLTHALGYVLRGLMEGYLFSGEDRLLKACLKTADGLLEAIRMDDGHLPGRLFPDWRPAVPWSCLTGMVQIAYCWLQLYSLTGNARYRDAAFAANRFVRRTVRVDGPDEQRGGVKGSFPVDGLYGRFEYLNWSCKFFIDANMLEKKVRAAEGSEDAGCTPEASMTAD
jgi:hypothetical protein